MKDSDLYKFASEYCDRSLTPAELESLNQALGTSADACERFLQICQLHGDLSFAARETQAVDHFLNKFEVINSLEDGIIINTFGGAPSVASKSRPTFFRKIVAEHGAKRVSWVAATAAAVVIGILLSTWIGRTPLIAERHAQIVGHITDASSAVWELGYEPNLEKPLLEGSQLVLREGSVRLSMTSGAECALEGPSRLLLQSRDAVALKKGKLTTRVAPWGSGFTVETEMMTVIDLGTSFTVTVLNSIFEASVLEGYVRVFPASILNSDRRSLLLSQGETIRIDAAQKKLTFPFLNLALPKNKLLSYLDESTPYHPIAISNTGVDLDLGDEDLHWRIVGGPSNADISDRKYAVVCKPDATYLPNVPHVSQWVSISEGLPLCKANSIFTFETKFDLTDFDLSTVVVVGQILADNGVRAIKINGVPIEMKPWVDYEPDQLFHKFRRVEINKGFVAGENTIQIELFNGIILWMYDENNPQPNPMALRVEWQGFGRKLETAAPKSGLQ